jgi:hypothetical protein
MKKDIRFSASIEGDERRCVSRNFGAGAQPYVVVGTAEGALHVRAWEEDGVVMVQLTLGRWKFGDNAPLHGPDHVLIYQGPLASWKGQP